MLPDGDFMYQYVPLLGDAVLTDDVDVNTEVYSPMAASLKMKLPAVAEHD